MFACQGFLLLACFVFRTGATPMMPSLNTTHDVAAVDADAMLAFKRALGAHEWMGDIPDCEWIGVTCDAEKRVVAIELDEHALTGVLPRELELGGGALERLERLSLETNKLTGSIEPALCGLGALRRLNLNYNRLSGELPACIGQLRKLSLLAAGGNKLSGELPTSIGELTEVRDITLCFNKLSGPLPDVFGSLRTLQTLWVSNNALDGELPASLCKATMLQRIYLTSNFISGSLPSCLRGLVHLKTLDISYNDLSGPLPELDSLLSLEQLDLSFNQISGSLSPELFTRMPHLRTLWLASNKFVGSLPSEIGQAAALQSLWLSFNKFRGNIPTQIGQLSSLVTLWLYSNEFSGTIPTELGKLEHLSELWVANNSLSGDAVPRDLIEGAKSLRLLDVGNNGNLGGVLPDDSVWHESGIEELRAPMCAISGTMPAALFGRETLRVLDLSFNKLAGTLPDVLQSASAMQSLLLSNNQFSGSPPRSLGLLRPGVAKALDLAFNNFRGALPRALQRVTSLTSLDVSYNRLSLIDAAALDDMAQLRACDLRGNELPCPLELRFCAVDCVADADAPPLAAAYDAAAADADRHRASDHAEHAPPPMPERDARGPLGEQRSGPLLDAVLEEALAAIVADEHEEQSAVDAAKAADRAELDRQALERARLERRLRERYAAHHRWRLATTPDATTVAIAGTALMIVALVYLNLAQRRRLAAKARLVATPPPGLGAAATPAAHAAATAAAKRAAAHARSHSTGGIVQGAALAPATAAELVKVQPPSKNL